jgi:hypothetical protein
MQKALTSTSPAFAGPQVSEPSFSPWSAKHTVPLPFFGANGSVMVLPVKEELNKKSWESVTLPAKKKGVIRGWNRRNNKPASIRTSSAREENDLVASGPTRIEIQASIRLLSAGNGQK